MQRAVTAHKEGKLQDADRLYRLVLKFCPNHPDANHNLGLLEVSANRFKEALPFFKTAIKTNPKIKQFWLSYVSALIRDNQFDNAKKVVSNAENFLKL